jgi:XTP/dITP diphosphohydrolase/ATP diphosphatase
MFTVMNLARHLKVDTETALRRTNARFRARFAAMEQAGGGADGLRAASSEELEALWVRAKTAERESCEPTSQRRDVGHPNSLAGGAV